MSTEIKEYQIQYLGGSGDWLPIEHVSGTKKQAFERLGYRRGRHTNDTWRLAEVVPVMEPASVSGWMVFKRGDDGVVFPAGGWAGVYPSQEKAVESVNYFIASDEREKYHIIHVEGEEKL